jgi:glycosyltransferase involved in cell wall biosynthesis
MPEYRNITPSPSLDLWYVSQGDVGNLSNAESIHSLNDCVGFAKYGYRATLLCSAFTAAELPKFVRVLTSRKGLPGRFLLEFRIMALLVLSKDKPDILYFRGPTNFLALSLLAFLLRKKIILELNGVFGYRYNHGGVLKSIYESFAEKIIYRLAFLIFCVTPELASLVERDIRNQGKVFIAENGVTISPLNHSLSSFSSSTPFTIGFIGKAYLGRALFQLVDLIKVLNNDNQVVRAKIIGGGPLTPRLIEYSADFHSSGVIQFIDSVSPSNLANVCKDIHLMWAVFEPDRLQIMTGLSPLKIWTSLSFAKPVLAYGPSGFLNRISKVPGVFTLIDLNDKSMLNALSDIILLHKQGTLANIGLEGYDYVSKQISWDKHCSIKDHVIRKAFASSIA